MAFYDHFYREVERTKLGERLVIKKCEHTLKILKVNNPKIKSILEIGPGKGDFGRICKKEGYKYACIEANLQLANQLKQQDFDTIIGRVPPIPFCSGTFDVVYASHVLEHMPTWENALNFIKECSRVVKPGGLIGIESPDYLKCGQYFWDVDYTHSFVTTKRRMQQICIDAGLKVREITTFSGPYTSLRAAFTMFVAKYFPLRFITKITSNLIEPERFYRGKLTFLGSILIVAEKDFSNG
jgi:SAM-dependent methyltransferase